MARSTFFAIVLLATDTWGDGGTVLFKQSSGSLAITVFSAAPLRAGEADLSVLVQSHPGGESVLDAEVEIALTPVSGENADPGAPLRTRATREAATNKLLYAALVRLPHEGQWRLDVDARHGGETARIGGEVAVGPVAPRLAGIWLYLGLPIVIISCYTLAQWVSRRLRA